jgi:hypothetical protein
MPLASVKERTMSHYDGDPLEPDSSLPWETPESQWESAENEDWRGELHLDDWPEDLAGPEYWLYKKKRDDRPE